MASKDQSYPAQAFEVLLLRFFRFHHNMNALLKSLWANVFAALLSTDISKHKKQLTYFAPKDCLWELLFLFTHGYALMKTTLWPHYLE